MKTFKMLMCCLMLAGFSYAQDSGNVGKSSFDKVLHSFSVQYNNCIHFPAHFDYHCDPTLGWKSIPSYGNEYSLGYEMISKSGFGFGLDITKGLLGLDAQTNDQWVSRYSSKNALDYVNLLEVDYWAVKAKATYSRILTDRIMLNTTIGLSFPFYIPTFITYERSSYNSINDDLTEDLFLNNDDCIRNWAPDLLLGVNFLFHTKRNPRNNFIVGCNFNAGFVPRYSGYFTLSESADQHDCDIKYGSSYFGINFGYSFIGFDKTFNRKKHRQESEYSTFDFNKAVHAVSLQMNNGLAVGGKALWEGPVKPVVHTTYSPSLSLKYSCLIRKGFGLSVSVPIGLFRRKGTISLQGVVPSDTLWANGTVGGNDSENGLSLLEPYCGLSLQASYVRQIHRNVFMQCDLGFSVQHLLYDHVFGTASTDDNGIVTFSDEMYAYIGNLYGLTADERIPFAREHLQCDSEVGWFPNICGGISFMVHGKNPCHNFVFGLNFNVDYTTRFSYDYMTLPTFPEKYKSFGRIAFNMTTIGLHLGYQFMTGKRVKWQDKR